MSDLIFCRYRHNVDPQLSYEAAIAENPANAPSHSGSRKKRAIYGSTRLWQPGRTLKFSFLGSPSTELKLKILNTGSQWVSQSGANLGIALYHDNYLQADIRIKLDPKALHNESALGTDALLIKTNETMTLNVLPDSEYFEPTVLHEFGHVFGATHEHQNPLADIPWNEDELMKVMTQQRGWSEADVRSQFLEKPTEANTFFTTYDRESIMHYQIAQWMTLGDWEVGANKTLSEYDLAFMRRAYPLANTPT